MDFKNKVIGLLNSKELTQEQKKKLEEIFPELCVSEDERIIIELISMVEEDWPGRSDVVAWLKSLKDRVLPQPATRQKEPDAGKDSGIKSEESASKVLETEICRVWNNTSDAFTYEHWKEFTECARHFSEWQKGRLVKWLGAEKDFLFNEIKVGRGDLNKQFRAELYKEIIAKLKDMD